MVVFHRFPEIIEIPKNARYVVVDPCMFLLDTTHTLSTHTIHMPSHTHTIHTSIMHTTSTLHHTHTQYTPQSHTPPGEQATLFAKRFGNRQERVAKAGRRGGGQADVAEVEKALGKRTFKNRIENQNRN